MQCSIWPAVERGRQYAFPAVWAAVLATGVGLSEPLPSFDIAPYLSFKPIGSANAASPDQPEFLALDAQPEALTFLRHDASEPDDTFHRSTREQSMGHGRFAAPGNAVRRQVQLRPISPRTADELAGFFRDVSYTLTDVRLGEAVPAIKVDRVPADLGSKDGNERKALFITAILPVVLEVNQRVLADREQLLALRDKLVTDPFSMNPIERIWLEDLADRYDATSDQLDELVRRVDIVPPSMAIAQGGVESGWGTSFAARTGNALFGQIQTVGRHSVAVPWKPGSGMPQPFLQRQRGHRGLHHQPEHASGLRALPQFPREHARAWRTARRLSPDRHAVALFRARPELRAVRAPDHARERAQRFRSGQAVRGVELLIAPASATSSVAADRHR